MIELMHVCDCGRMEEETKSAGHDGGCASVHSASVSVYSRFEDRHLLLVKHQTVTEQCGDFLCISHFQAVNTLLQHKAPSSLFAETLSL